MRASLCEMSIYWAATRRLCAWPASRGAGLPQVEASIPEWEGTLGAREAWTDLSHLFNSVTHS